MSQAETIKSISEEFAQVCKADQTWPYMDYPEEKIQEYLESNLGALGQAADAMSSIPVNGSLPDLPFDRAIFGKLLNDPKYDNIKQQIKMTGENFNEFTEALRDNPDIMQFLEENPEVYARFIDPTEDVDVDKFLEAGKLFMCDPKIREPFLKLVVPHDEFDETQEQWKELIKEGTEMQAQKDLAAQPKTMAPDNRALPVQSTPSPVSPQ